MPAATSRRSASRVVTDSSVDAAVDPDRAAPCGAAYAGPHRDMLTATTTADSRPMYLRDMTASSADSGIDPMAGGTYGSGHCCEQSPRRVRTVQPSRAKGPSTDSVQAVKEQWRSGRPALRLAPSTAGPRTVDPRVMDVAEARDLAYTLLHATGNRWLHVQAVAARAEELRGAVGPAEGELLVAAAWLHDIGYSPELSHEGFHPLDGARYSPPPDIRGRRRWSPTTPARGSWPSSEAWPRSCRRSGSSRTP